MAEQTPAPTRLTRRHHQIVTQTLRRWRQQGLIDEPTAARLGASITVAGFDWQRTARYAFVVSLLCIVVAVGALVADEALMRLLRRVFDAPALLKSAFFAAVSAATFRYGRRLARQSPHRRYASEAVSFLGVLALAVAVSFLGAAVDTGSGHYSVLFAIAALLYAVLGLWFPSPLVWIFALLSFGTWMGTETGYVSGGGMYFLGMNFPLRFVVFGAALTALGIIGERSTGPVDRPTATLTSRLLSMSTYTKVIGLLNLFIALWIMSIFGNYGDVLQWHNAGHAELLMWSVLFGAVAVAAIWYGLRRDDATLRGFGLTFLIINLYTRYFEYLWNSMHKALFFALLAVSFWYLGSRAEAIWHLGGRKRGGVPTAPARGNP